MPVFRRLWKQRKPRYLGSVGRSANLQFVSELFRGRFLEVPPLNLQRERRDSDGSKSARHLYILALTDTHIFGHFSKCGLWRKHINNDSLVKRNPSNRYTKMPFFPPKMWHLGYILCFKSFVINCIWLSLCVIITIHLHSITGSTCNDMAWKKKKMLNLTK